jgi:NaMN:DMB phosphoribosyltransferase
MQMGRGLRRPLLLAECVPGGTTTAQAVLQGLGLSVAGLVGGSALHPPMVLKQRLVAEGLRRADLGAAPTPGLLLAAVGDPFQAVAAGLLVGALESGQPLLLGGGSQMVAVLALALAALPPRGRAALAAQVVLGTTAWLGSEQLEGLQPGSPPALSRLLNCLQGAMGVELLALTSGLRFVASRHQALEDYEQGHVKEGVGAGALALLAQLRGVSPAELQESCEEGLDRLQRQ